MKVFELESHHSISRIENKTKGENTPEACRTQSWMEINNTETLVRKVVAGDNEAFRSLCDSKYRSIYYQAYVIMKNHHDAEDAVQIVLCKIYDKISTLKNPKAFNSWLYRLVSNECNMMLRKKISRKEDINYNEEKDSRIEENIDIIPDKKLESDELEGKVAEVINKLPAIKRQAIYLYFYEHLSYKEIADIMDIGINTVATHIKRAKEMIKKELEKTTDFEIQYHNKESGHE